VECASALALWNLPALSNLHFKFSTLHFHFPDSPPFLHSSEFLLCLPRANLFPGTRKTTCQQTTHAELECFATVKLQSVSHVLFATFFTIRLL
jgi:hypothetical protein